MNKRMKKPTPKRPPKRRKKKTPLSYPWWKVHKRNKSGEMQTNSSENISLECHAATNEAERGSQTSWTEVWKHGAIAAGL